MSCGSIFSLLRNSCNVRSCVIWCVDGLPFAVVIELSVTTLKPILKSELLCSCCSHSCALALSRRERILASTTLNDLSDSVNSLTESSFPLFIPCEQTP